MTTAVEEGEALGGSVAAYTGAVAALRASQQAAAEAAAAAAAEQSSGGGGGGQLDLSRMLEPFGYSPEDCVPYGNGYACGGLP